MAQAERRRAQNEASAATSDAAETASTVVSRAATTGDAWMQGQAELIENIEQISHRWLRNRRQAIEATRQLVAEIRQCRDFADVLRVQNEWLSGSLQRLASDFHAFTSTALGYSRHAVMWAGHSARAAREENFSTRRDK